MLGVADFRDRRRKRVLAAERHRESANTFGAGRRLGRFVEHSVGHCVRARNLRMRPRLMQVLNFSELRSDVIQFAAEDARGRARAA